MPVFGKQLYESRRLLKVFRRPSTQVLTQVLCGSKGKLQHEACPGRVALDRQLAAETVNQ